MYIPFFLLDTRVDCGTGEVARAQEIVELLALLGRANEDDDLVEQIGEFEDIKGFMQSTERPRCI